MIQEPSSPCSPGLKKKASEVTDIESSQELSALQTKDPLIDQLFGKKTYRYRLALAEEIPSTLYKERNFNLKVKLIDQENNTIMNGNVISLCLAVCDGNGEWACENKAKQSIMKGKTDS
jgi:hypothetical protein